MKRYNAYQRPVMHVFSDYFVSLSTDIHHTTKPRQNYHRTRRKRSSRRRHERAVETLVVVDKHMNTKHGRENLTTYVLSIFNVVS